MATTKCKKCGSTERYQEGNTSRCAPCVREKNARYRAENAVKRAAYRKKYNAEHREEIRAYKRQLAELKRVYVDKPCLVCSKEFRTTTTSKRKYCSPQCKGKRPYLTGRADTDKQYEAISGNWRRYLSRLITKARREDGLTLDYVLELLERQDYKCALTGENLTCILQSGRKIKTNVSIDRIIAGGSYAPDNIQLVCAVVNGFRRETDVDEFIEWCNKVTAYTSRRVTSKP